MHTRIPCHRLLSAYGNCSLWPGIISVPPRPDHLLSRSQAVDMALPRHRGDKRWTAMDNPSGCPRAAHRLPPLAHSGPRSTRQRPELADVTNSLNTLSLQARPLMTGHGSRAPSRPNRAARGPAPQAWGERRPVGTIRTGGGLATGGRLSRVSGVKAPFGGHTY